MSIFSVKKEKGKKKEKRSFVSYIWKLSVIFFILKWLFFIGLFATAVFVSTSHPQSFVSIKHRIDSFLNRVLLKERSVTTIESLFDKDDILPLIKLRIPPKGYTIGEIKSLYSPYLRVDVKYVSEDKITTKESSMLWSLTEGEMLLSLDSFRMTSGFHECIHSHANTRDFYFLHSLAHEDEKMLSISQMANICGLHEDQVAKEFESLQKRHLITFRNGVARLHMIAPFFQVDPITYISKPFVQKNISTLRMIPETFSQSSIETCISHAYGREIAILNSEFVWLPIYQITIQNPDGSQQNLFWNAISGNEITGKSLQTLKKYATI